jgi:hypothetical protein
MWSTTPQLQVHLRRLMCPTTEDGILTLKPLHRVRHEGSLLGVRIQTCTPSCIDSCPPPRDSSPRQRLATESPGNPSTWNPDLDIEVAGGQPHDTSHSP